MTVSVTRDEFETVRQLLASAAAYAESASRQSALNTDAIARFDLQRTESQKRTDEKFQQLAESQKRTDEKFQQLAKSQERTDEVLKQLYQRIDSFIFESQQSVAESKQRINYLDKMIDRYDGVLAYLRRKDHPEMK